MRTTCARPLTCTGSVLVISVPSPSWPRPLQPQVQTVPSDFRAAVWQSPADTSTNWPTSPLTWMGTSLLANVLLPNSPVSFAPQVQTVPSDLTATAWNQPAETCATLLRTLTETGTVLLV